MQFNEIKASVIEAANTSSSSSSNDNYIQLTEMKDELEKLILGSDKQNANDRGEVSNYLFSIFWSIIID
jgi:hypothetical protein